MKEKRMEFYMTTGVSIDMDADNRFACEIGNIIHRYVTQDWGDLCEQDKELNRRALSEGGRIVAAYETGRGRVYVITDDTLAMPTVTTVLYAHE